MSVLAELREKYSVSPHEFSLEESSKAIEESLNLVDDLLSEKDSSDDKMVSVFTIINEILLLCLTSSDLSPYSLNVWKRYIPLLKHGNNSHSEIVAQIAHHLTTNCSLHIRSLIPAVVNIENTVTLAQSEVDAIGLVLFFDQRLCATLAYFAACLPRSITSNNFALLLCFHGLMLHASTVIGGCASFVEKSGEGLLKACTLRQSSTQCPELHCYHIIKELIYDLMLPEQRSNLFKHQDTCILVGAQHLTILYLRFMVECLQTSVDLTDPIDTLLLMLDIFLECSSLLAAFSCGVMMSDVTMMSNLSELLSLALTVSSLCSDNDNAYEKLVDFLLLNALMLDSSTAHCSAVGWQVRAHQARFLFLGLLRSCESSTQLSLCQRMWEYRMIDCMDLYGWKTVGSHGHMSQRRWKCAADLFKGVLLVADPSCQVYLIKQLGKHAVSTAEGSRVDAVCDLLRHLPLLALFQTHHSEVQSVTQQLIETSLASVMDQEISTGGASGAMIRRECALSVLCALSTEGVQGRLMSQSNASFERLVKRLIDDRAVNTYVVNWIIVLSDFLTQLTAKLSNASVRVVQSRLDRFRQVLQVLHLLLRVLSAHELPKGVVSKLAECAVACCQSSSMLWTKGFGDDKAVEGMIVGLRAALLAVQLTAVSPHLTGEQGKKLVAGVNTIVDLSKRLTDPEEPNAWKLASAIRTSLTQMRDALGSVSSIDGRMLLQVCHDSVKPQGVVAVDDDRVVAHLLSFTCTPYEKEDIERSNENFSKRRRI